MIALDIIASVAGFALPAIVDLTKSIFGIKSSQEGTLSTLATTNPEVMPQYIDALARLKDAETKWFQRDVTGELSKWILNFRGFIRPFGTAFSFAALTLNHSVQLNLTPGTEASFCFVLGNWFGSRK